MKQHVNEPWSAVEVTNDEDQLIKIRASNGANIARLWIDVDDNHFSDEQRENARRIVACVNACRGLPTDELEQKGIVAAVGTQLLEADQLRDELLAALELMVAIHDEPSGFSGKYGKALDDAIQAQEEKIDERLLMARTAIAKAKGGVA
ncbi:hypothetical protein [Aeromonas jandaei]|uniref:hypothetical protein n=1 Tax=Aeromonas jandaei TaxID=650 RepID=UPI00059BAA90|nr:hypothetical protein [Aeromonas jandaei]